PAARPTCSDDDEPVRHVEDLHVTYESARRNIKPVLAVDGVSFDLAPREVLALVGESGRGKHSIARDVMRLVRPSGGRIVFQGRDITTMSRKDLRPIRAGMQMVF